MPSPMTIKGRGRGKSDARMAVVKWARQNGAINIKVDGIELTFASAWAAQGQMGLSRAHNGDGMPAQGSDGPELDHSASDAVRSQHPDEFADQSDRWQHFNPLSARG